MGNSTSGPDGRKKRRFSKRSSKKKNKNASNNSSTKIEEADHDWILECIVEYIQSPGCIVFVDGFIDENCLVFDRNATEEDRFTYQHIHIQYKEMIENLLVSTLSKLGLTPQQFTDACKMGNRTKLDSNVLQYINAIDNFKIFKEIMIERNISLEKEALAYLAKQNGIKNEENSELLTNHNNMTEEEQLKWALSESMALSKENEKFQQQIQSSVNIQKPTPSQQPLPEQKKDDYDANVVPSAPPIDDHNPFEMIANINMSAPKRASLKPLKLSHNKSAFEALTNDDALPTLTASSIKDIKIKQMSQQKTLLLQQKQKILNLRKKQRSEMMEEPDWDLSINPKNKNNSNNPSSLPPLHKSLFAKMKQDDNNNDGEFTLQ